MVGTSLVVQGLRMCLAVQGTQIQFLAGELGSHMLQGNQACLLQLRPDAVKLKKKKKKNQKNKKVANVKKDISCSMYMLK